MAAVNGVDVLGHPASHVRRALLDAPHPRELLLRRKARPYFPTEQWVRPPADWQAARPHAEALSAPPPLQGGAMDFIFGHPGYGNRFQTASFVRSAVRSSAADMRRSLTLGLQNLNDFSYTVRRVARAHATPQAQMHTEHSLRAQGSRPLHAAAAEGALSAVAWILMHGADMAATDSAVRPRGRARGRGRASPPERSLPAPSRPG